MNEILIFLVENAIEIVFSLIGLALTAFAVPWLKNTAIPWLKDKQLYGIIEKFVKAAEKFAENNEIDKKTYVTDLLKAKGIKVTPIVDALIETAVEELDLLKKKTAQEIVGDMTEEENLIE